MKKLWFLWVFLLLLAGCGPNNTEIERAMTLRGRILQGQQCAFDVNITADYGDKLHQFGVSCQGDSQGNLTFTVNEPESIAGITGKISDTGGKLTFDDTALQFDTMADDTISPVSAPWIFLKTLRSGNLTSAGMEAESLRLSIDDSYEDDALHMDIWLDEGDFPQRAEILYEGKRILSLDIKNFQIQ